jgi:nucleoside-diphosphate-sugar epimerase
MWPEAIRAVREARPDGFLFENVRNLAGPRFRTYLDWIISSLRRPTLARMAKRAAPGRRVIGVARFTDPALPAALRAHGIETMACDLLDRAALERLRDATPDATNVVFMAGHKFGASGNPSLTWAMNVGVPAMVAEAFRDRRIVAFSTACVYPFVDTAGPGAPESLAALPPRAYECAISATALCILIGSSSRRRPRSASRRAA